MARVSVAMILSVASVLRDEIGWDGGPLSGETWSLLAVSLAAALGLVMLFVRRNVAFALVNVWALVALSIVVFLVRSRGGAAPAVHSPAT